MTSEDPSDSSSTSAAEAADLLRSTAWFQASSDAFVQALASHMKRETVSAGHVFVKEGEAMQYIMLLQEGRLIRVKSVGGGGSSAKSQGKSSSTPSQASDGNEASPGLSDPNQGVIVDDIVGHAKMSGLLHNVCPDSLAYATIQAATDSTVWLLSGQDFRSVMTQNPSFALEMLQAFARELRQGSKSLRALVQAVQQKGRSHDGDGSSSATDSWTDSQICRVLCYDATAWVTQAFEPAIKAFNKEHESNKESKYRIEMDFTTERLSEQSAMYAAGYDAVCLFVNDNANANVLQTLSEVGVRMIAMRSAGFDRVDTTAARAYGLTVARVPAYSPYAVAEMAIALLMAVNRKTSRANSRVKMANFSLDAGLMGFDIHDKIVGVMGTGKIGRILCQILNGFGAHLLCYDVVESDEVKAMGGTYVTPDDIFGKCDIIFLMMPLLPATYHIINEDTLPKLKHGVVLINTSRGGLVDTKALLKGLRSGIISGVGMDVYENEAPYFFQDWSARKIEDSDLTTLLGHHDVVLTAHQAFFTQEAVDKIVQTTVENIQNYHQKGMVGSAHPNSCL
jgi:D-lactate dehydrogenase